MSKEGHPENSKSGEGENRMCMAFEILSNVEIKKQKEY